MPVTRPEYWPLVALTPLANFAIPPSGVILQGWGIGAVFPSRDANWLFRQQGDWLKYTETRAIQGPDALSTSLVQRVSSTQLDFPTGAGLQVAPDSGGVYIIGGERVDLSTASTVYSGVLAPTFAPSTTNYVHARLMPNTGGPVTIGSVGEILVSTNGSEAGYSRILEVTTDATDITGTAEPIALSIGYEWATKITFADMAVTLLTFERAIGLGSSGNDTLTLQVSGSDKALAVTGATTDDLANFTQTGDGVAVQVTGGASNPALRANAGAGQIAVSATSGTNATSAIAGMGSGTAIGVDGLGGASGTGATGVRGTGGQSKATGVHGRTAANGDTDAYGVRGEGRGPGAVGVKAESAAGRALVVQADASTPDYPAMQIKPQDADPSVAPEDGDTFWHADHKSLRTGVSGGGYRTMLTMGPGSALYQVATQNYSTTHSVGGVYADLLTVSCLEAQGQGFFSEGSGGVLISFSCDVRVPSPPRTIDVNLFVNGVSVAEWAGSGTAPTDGFEMGLPTSNWGQRPITFELLHAPGVDGDLTVTVQVRSVAGGGANPEIRNAGLKVVGTFLVV